MGNVFSDKKDDKPETTRAPHRTMGAFTKNRGLSMLSMYKQQITFWVVDNIQMYVYCLICKNCFRNR